MEDLWYLDDSSIWGQLQFKIDDAFFQICEDGRKHAG